MEDKKTNNGFDWSKWGFWLAIMLFLFSSGMWFYQTYIYEAKPDLELEIISNEKALLIIEDLYKKQEIVLDADDFVETEFLKIED